MALARPWMPIAFLAFAAPALSGCVTSVEHPAELQLNGRWGAWQDKLVPALILLVRNVGEETGAVGPGAEAPVVVGPAGSIPIAWASPFAMGVHPGAGVTLPLFARLVDGSLTLAQDASVGIPVVFPSGNYRVCLGVHCTTVVL